MDDNTTPHSSESPHTPLRDESIKSNVALDDKPVDDLVEEQLDYEEFIEQSESKRFISESELNVPDSKEVYEEDGECISETEDVIYMGKEPKQQEEGECYSDNENNNSEKENINDGKGEVSATKEVDNDVKMEEVDIPIPETPWERGLRLARERRELAKQKKAEEKDKLREKQLHINLDNALEVEPILKKIDRKPAVDPQILKALEPIAILPEDPKPNEMILEYYLSENSNQHRLRFIPSKLYTLDPWEVEEWKRELDMIKFETDMIIRKGRSSSRSSNDSRGQRAMKTRNRKSSAALAQVSLNRDRPVLEKLPGHGSKSAVSPSSKSRQHISRKDLPSEFRNRKLSPNRTRSSSGGSSDSSSSGSSSTGSSSSGSTVQRNKKQLIRKKAGESKSIQGQGNNATFKTVKKPALGRGRSESSANSSSDSTSNDSGSSSDSSSDSSEACGKTQKGSKKFINSVSRPQKPRLHGSKLTAGDGKKVGPVIAKDSNIKDMDEVINSKINLGGLKDKDQEKAITSELPSADSRPGVKLKLVSRPKPLILGTSEYNKVSISKSNKKVLQKTHDSNSKSGAIETSESTGIFSNSKPIFTTSANRNSEIPASAKESTLKSNLAATQLEMQQEFLRNYKDKIAIYRSQLSYQQQRGGGHIPGSAHTLTHSYAPPIKGPITVMSVTSKKTGPPKPPLNITSNSDKYYDKYSNNSKNFRANYSPVSYNYRDRPRRNSRNRSRSTTPVQSNRGGYGYGNRGSRYQDNSNYRDRGNDRYHKNEDKFQDSSYKNSGFDRYRGDKDNWNHNNGRCNKVDNRGTGGNRYDNYNSNNRGFRGRDNDRGSRYNNNNNRDNSMGGRYNSRYNRGGNRENSYNRDIHSPVRNASRQRSVGFANEDDEVSKSATKAVWNFEESPNTDSINNRKRRKDTSPTGWPHKWDNPSENEGSPVSKIINNKDNTSIGKQNIDSNVNSSVSVPKEKRREELLKQLKAVEDAIAKKKAKIDK